MKLLKCLCMGLIVMFFASSAQAESPLLTLPFGMEIGKKVSEKLLDRCYSEEEGDFECKDKFRGIITKDKKLKSLVFANGARYVETLPTRWRKLGLNLKGNVSMKKALQIIRKQGAEHIEIEPDEGFGRDVDFDLAGKYHFKMVFRANDEGQTLWVFRVNGNTMIEDY